MGSQAPSPVRNLPQYILVTSGVGLDGLLKLLGRAPRVRTARAAAAILQLSEPAKLCRVPGQPGPGRGGRALPRLQMRAVEVVSERLLLRSLERGGQLVPLGALPGHRVPEQSDLGVLRLELFVELCDLLREPRGRARLKVKNGRKNDKSAPYRPMLSANRTRQRPTAV